MSFADVLSGVARGVCVIGEVYDTYKQVEKLSQDDGDPTLRAISVATKIGIMSLNVVEAVGSVSGQLSSKTLTGIKGAELAVRTVHLPIKLMETLEETDSVTEVVEQGIILPLAGMLRTGLEYKIYEEKSYLDLPPEKFDKTKRPIYEQDIGSEVPRIVGYKPLNRQECKEFIDSAKQARTSSTVVECLARTKTFTQSTNSIEDIYHRLVGDAPRVQNPMPGPAILGVVPPQAPVVDPLNLLDSAVIPEPLHDDQVFRRYICPITQTPIRHPVGDPNGVTVYERSEILRWIHLHHRSPMTQQPLFAHQLTPKPGLQALINHRLQFYQDRFVALAQQEAETAADVGIQGAADLENPNY